MKEKRELEIFINPSSGVPIYIQIADAIKYAIATGILRDGEKLPAVRDLAYQITTNPNTVAKAYQRLIHAKLVEVKRGIGTFVIKRNKTSKNLERLRRIICTLVKEAKEQGISMDEIRRMIREEINSGIRDRDKKS